MRRSVDLRNAQLAALEEYTFRARALGTAAMANAFKSFSWHTTEKSIFDAAKIKITECGKGRQAPPYFWEKAVWFEDEHLYGFWATLDLDLHNASTALIHGIDIFKERLGVDKERWKGMNRRQHLFRNGRLDCEC